MGSPDLRVSLFDFTDKPSQRGFFYDTSPVVAYFGGYGNGKTYAACGKGWLLGECFPGNVVLIGRKTYPALKSSTMVTFLNIAKARNGGSLEPGPVIKVFNKSDNFMELQNGSKFFFRTLDEVEKLRSMNLGAAVVDQAEEVAYEIYLELLGRTRFWGREKIRAWMDEHRDSLEAQYGVAPKPYNQLICVGNPKPNWVKREFKLGKGCKLYEASTRENQRFLPADYIEKLTARYPKEWVDRFIDGSWDTHGGQVFREFQMDELHGIWHIQIPETWPVFVGWDHGITNPTACMVGCVDEEGNIILVDEYYRSGLTVDQYAQEAKAMMDKWKVPKSQGGDYIVHMDPSTKANKGTGEIDVWEAYRRNGIFGLNANNKVMDGILWMQYLIHPDPSHPYPQWHPKRGQLGAPRFFVMRPLIDSGAKGCANFVNEMALYEWADADMEGEESQLNYAEAPRKWKDHSIDAVRYLLMAVKEKRADTILTPAEEAKRQQDKAAKQFIENVFTREEPLQED